MLLADEPGGVYPPPPPPPASAPYVAPANYGIDPNIQAGVAWQNQAPSPPTVSAPPPPPAPPVAYPSATPPPALTDPGQPLYQPPPSAPTVPDVFAPLANPSPALAAPTVPSAPTVNPNSPAGVLAINAQTPAPPAATPPIDLTTGINPNSPAGVLAINAQTQAPASTTVPSASSLSGPGGPLYQPPTPPIDLATGVVNAPPPDPSQIGTGTPADPDVQFANDPVYLASKAENELAKKTAAGNYLEGLKTMLLQFGDVNLAHKVLDGIGPQVQQYLGSAPDLASYFAQYVGIDNPDTSFSQMAQYNRSIREGQKSLMEGVNNQGLFYSGAGAKALSDFQYQSQAKLQAMLSSVRASVAQAGQDFFGQLQGAQTASIGAMNDAYNRLVKDALNGQFDLSGINVKVPGADGTGASAGKPPAPAPPKPPSQIRTKAQRTAAQIAYSTPKAQKALAARNAATSQRVKPPPRPPARIPAGRRGR